MNTRTTSETISFRRSFRLSVLDDLLPAGTYVVETEEELLQTLSFPVYRRVSMVIRLAGTPGSAELSRLVPIDPEELAALQACDAALD